MTAKIYIDLPQGIVSAEGDPGFVRQVYADYKDNLFKKITQTTSPQEKQNDESPPKRKKLATRKRKQRNRLKASTNGEENDINPDDPRIDPNLKIEVPDLEEFYNQFNIKNHPEAILIFTKYLTEKAKIEEPNTDQIFTCFRMVNHRLPEKFAQAFRDAKTSRTGYINYNSLKEGINITPIGHNHFNKMLKQKTRSK